MAGSLPHHHHTIMETFNHNAVAPSDAPDHFIAAVVALSTAAETQEATARAGYAQLNVEAPSDVTHVVDAVIAGEWNTTVGMVRLARAFTNDRGTLAQLVEIGLAENHPGLLALGSEYQKRNTTPSENRGTTKCADQQHPQ